MAAQRSYARRHPNAAPVKPSPQALARSREVPALRTANSDTYVLGGNHFATKLSGQPVNYQTPDGQWQPIHNHLVPTATGYRNAANVYRVALPAVLGASPVRFTAPGGQIAFALRGAHGRGQVAGATETFANALPGTTVRYTAASQALQETLTLTGRRAPLSFTYDLQLGAGLHAALGQDGVIRFLNAGGGTVAWFAPASVTDVSRPGEASQRLVQRLSANGSRLTVTLNRAWASARLLRGDRLVIDPWTGTGPATADCTIQQAQPTTSSCAGPTDYVGSNGGTEQRTLVRFDVQSVLPRDVQVLYSGYAQDLTSKTGTADADLALYPVKRPWSAGVTWQTTDGTTSWSNAGGDTGDQVADIPWAGQLTGDGGEIDWHDAKLDSLIQQWNDGTAPNYGLEIKDASGSSDVFGFANSSSSGDGTPSLIVEYQPRLGAYPNAKFDSQQLTDRMTLGVNVANGNLLLKNHDLAIHGTGLDLTADRYFNGLSADGALGVGWTLTAGQDLRLYTESDNNHHTLYGPSGYVTEFHKDSNDDTKYVGSTELHQTLENPSSGTYTLTDHQKTVETFSGADCTMCADFLTSVKDRNGNQIQYRYDDQNSQNAHLQSIVDTQGRTVTVSTDASSGLITGMQDSTGRTWGYHYTNGQLTSYTDPNGKTTSYAYDAAGDLSQITTPAGRQVKMTYVDPASGDYRVASVTRVTNLSTGAGNTTSYSYSLPGDSSWTCQDTDFEQTIVTDPDGHQTTYCFDTSDRATKVTDARGNGRSTGYDQDGNVVDFQGQGAGPSTASFDGNDNLTQVTDADQVSQTASYGDTTNKYFASQTVDGAGSTQNYCYLGGGGTSASSACSSIQGSSGPDGSLKAILDDQNNVLVHYSYNTNGTLAAATDANGTTTYLYDSNGNLTKVTPDATAQVPPGSTQMGSTSYTPDGLSRMSQMTDAKNQTTGYTYDNLDRLTKVTYSDDSSVTYHYDDDGNMTSEVDSNANASDNTGTITKTYDNVGRLTQELLPNGQSNTYAYDQTGNLQTFTDSGGTVTYGYDPVNDLSRIAEPSGSCTTRPATLCSTFAYDTNDNRTQAKLADGVTETTDWTPGGRMQDTTAKDSTGQVLTSDNYGYTQSGKFGPLIASMTDQDGYEQSYSYDTLDRLTGLTSSSNPATDNVSWSFDGAGNRTQETHPAGQSTWQWSFNADDQTCYIQSTSCSSPPSGAVAYTFDADGNQTGGPTPSLAYNARNQTVSIGGTTEVYQGAGQSDLVKDGQIALQNNAMGIGVISDPTNGTDHLVREPDGQLFSSLQNNKREYFLFDAQNDVVGEANNSGQLDFKVRYSSPYDESDWYMIQNVPVYFAFKSGYWTAGSYYHFGERYYDTWAGRFTQPDQVAHPYDVKQYDAYGFVANNPIMLSDPLGLESYGSACGSEAETGAAVGAVTGPEDAAVGAATGCATGIVKKFTTDEFGKTAGEVVGVLANFKTGSDLVKGAESVASDVGDALDSVF